MSERWKQLKAVASFAGKLGRGRTNENAANSECTDDDVQIILEHLLDTNGQKTMNLKETQLRPLLSRAKDVMLQDPMLLELNAPINICGDIHGQFSDLIRIFTEVCGLPGKNSTKFLFLGDYVDRGKQSLESIFLLLCFKVLVPDQIFLLRGNHECSSINRVYGFYDECKRRYSVKLWKCFTDVFNCLPCTAVVAESIICMHGGLSPELQELDQIRQLKRPCEVPEEGILSDLLWSDPQANGRGWRGNDRGVSYTFGADVVKDFLNHHDLDLVCRAHQVVEDGYEFFADRRLVTLFSAPNYCGQFNNAGAVMTVSASLQCSFKLIRDSNSLRDFPQAAAPVPGAKPRGVMVGCDGFSGSGASAGSGDEDAGEDAGAEAAAGGEGQADQEGAEGEEQE